MGRVMRVHGCVFSESFPPNEPEVARDDTIRHDRINKRTGHGRRMTDDRHHTPG